MEKREIKNLKDKLMELSNEGAENSNKIFDAVAGLYWRKALIRNAYNSRMERINETETGLKKIYKKSILICETLGKLAKNKIKSIRERMALPELNRERRAIELKKEEINKKLEEEAQKKGVKVGDLLTIDEEVEIELEDIKKQLENEKLKQQSTLLQQATKEITPREEIIHLDFFK